MPDGCHRDIGQSYTMAFTQQTAERLPSGAELSRLVDRVECEPGHSTLVSMG